MAKIYATIDIILEVENDGSFDPITDFSQAKEEINITLDNLPSVITIEGIQIDKINSKLDEVAEETEDE